MINTIVFKIQYGSCSEMPNPGTALDQALEQAADLDDGAAITLLSPFVGCSFDHANLNNDISDLIASDDELACSSLKIAQLEWDFTQYAFPMLTVEASFQFESEQALTEAAILAWEATHREQLVGAFSAYWLDADERVYFDSDQGLSIHLV